jgi:hypothetical protein
MAQITSYPTGLERRFDDEMAAAIPGWKREYDPLPIPPERVEREQSIGSDEAQSSAGVRIRKLAAFRKKETKSSHRRVRIRRFPTDGSNPS